MYHKHSETRTTTALDQFAELLKLGGYGGDLRLGRALGEALVAEISAIGGRAADVAALISAVESLLGVIDGVGVSFKNGVTDPTGTIDEGEVYAGRALDAVEQALRRLRAP